MSKIININCILSDVYFHVLKFMDFKTLYLMSQICRYWRHISHKDDFWRHLLKKRFPFLKKDFSFVTVKENYFYFFHDKFADLQKEVHSVAQHEQKLLETHQWPTAIVARSNDDIICGHKSGNISVWDLKKGVKKMTLYGHSRSITSIAYDSRTQRFFTSSKDKTIRIWDKNYNLIGILEGHKSQVEKLVTSENPCKLYSSSLDDVVIIWDTTNLAILSQVSIDGNISWIIENPQKRMIYISVWGGKIDSLDDNDFTHLFTIAGYQGSTSCSILDPEGNKLFIGGQNGSIYVINANNGNHLNTYSKHDGSVICIKCDFSKQRAISCGIGSHDIMVWDINKSVQVFNMRGHDGWIQHLEIDTDNRIIFTSGWDSSIMVWDYMRGRRLYNFHSSHITPQSVLKYDKTSKRLISGDWHGNVCITPYK